MFSEKQFRAWQDMQAETEERERRRIRSEVEAEVNATFAQIDREREAEASREQWARSLGLQSTARSLDGIEISPDRQARIRSEVEREVRGWEAQRAQQTRQTLN